MKSLSEQLQNFDRENFRRVAHGLPEVQDARDRFARLSRLLRYSTACLQNCAPRSRLPSLISAPG
jgi:hypothetical protein